MTDRPAFHQADGPLTVPVVLCGLGITVVLFALTRAQAATAAEADAAAAHLLVAGRALAGTQARVRRLVDSNLIGVFFCRGDGTVLDGNRAFFRLLGRDVPAAGGPPLRLADVTDPSGHPAQAAALARLAPSSDGSGVRSLTVPPFEVVLLRPGGDPVPVLLGLAAAAADEVVAFTLDLTDRHRAERDLRRAKEAAEHASRAKDQFLAVLSHELRTPLTPVLAAATAAEADPRLPADVRDEMAMIHRNVELEARLIDDLLDLTRVGRGKLQLTEETVDLHAAVAGAVEVCVVPDPSAAGPVPGIEPSLTADVYHVRGDPARLRQIVWNLVKNAVKFTPPDGRVTVGTYNPRPGVVCIVVADTGVGIEPDVLPKVFDAFEQGSPARAKASGGLGLGLAITRGLVDAHGGTIAVASDGLGRGATFTVTLPTTDAPAAPAAVPTADPPPVRSGRLLLVEDHGDTARIMAKLLVRAGHEVTVAGSVAAAVRAAAAPPSGRPFDLLVSDFGLPDGSGADVLAGFRKTPGHAATPALALTGFGSDLDLSRSADAGFAQHLTKPVAFDALQRTIGRLLAAGDRR